MAVTRLVLATLVVACLTSTVFATDPRQSCDRMMEVPRDPTQPDEANLWRKRKDGDAAEPASKLKQGISLFRTSVSESESSVKPHRSDSSTTERGDAERSAVDERTPKEGSPIRVHEARPLIKRDPS